MRESRNGHEPAPATEGRNHAATRPAEAGSTAGTEQPGTSLAALIQEAEALHATLADAKSRTARLIAGLRRHRKQSRLVNETLKSLRQLRLVETSPADPRGSRAGIPRRFTDRTSTRWRIASWP